MTDVLTADYTTQDAAFALEHGNFGDFRRNLMRADLLVLPRHIVTGRAGGEYRYGHILEMALQIHVGGAFGRECAKSVIWSGFRRLKANDTGLKKFNALSDEDKTAIRNGGTFSRDEDPRDLSWFVEFPHVVLGNDLISRDPSHPTVWMFTRHIYCPEQLLMINGDVSLFEAHRRITEAMTAGFPEDQRHLVATDCHVAGSVNLTEICNRLEYLLSIRLRARSPIGR